MARGPVDVMSLSAVLAENVRQLRAARGLTQAQLAKSAGVPRATWANLESGEANPTLHVISAVSRALGVSLEELLSAPRAACVLHPRETLPTKKRGTVTVRNLLPDPLPGSNIDRIELPPGARMTGIPHTPGTREYLTVERGSIVLAAAGERFTLREGDVLAFRGDQRHSYANPSTHETAIGYSVVILVDAGR
ncbi:XRE family transcriptional regulator [Sandaracinus amylolyticus]|uniref:XRE family transcriptional regulator n=1 Tax=Sandaracinus amylolyticus TaxID=927083 RepID=UPI001F2F3D07|nr:XRE family transcriptional regulator [Sandaracinus amylolyticus]